jgi:DNA-binding CsgD family transcriptional regulator
VLEEVSRLVLELHRGARRIDSEHFQEWAFERAERLLRFDSGFWAYGTHETATPAIHRAYLYRQPASLLTDYAALAHLDTAAVRSLQSGGRTINATWRELGEPARWVEYVERYKIKVAVITCVVDAVTKTFSVISFWRGDEAAPFSEAERVLAEALVPHMFEAYANALLRERVQQAESGVRRAYFPALVDAQGVIFMVDANFASLMREEWPEWTGPHPPAELTRHLADHGDEDYIGERIVVRPRRVEDLVLLRIRNRLPIDGLGHRERQVASLAAAGRSFKEIAKDLGISPATVNNHLANIYRKLQVRNRAELVTLLNGLR